MTESETVRERIEEEIDGRIHGIARTASRGSTAYLVVSHSTSAKGADRLAVTTVVVDLDEETVKPTGNSLWVPRDPSAAEGLTQVMARATTDVTNDRGDPAAEIGDGIEDVLGTEIEPDEYDGPEEATTSPPEEVHVLDERLAEAGIGTEERYIRLRFGTKEPFSHKMGDTDYLAGDYGVYATSDDPLVLVDVDDPDALDAALPETFRTTSPHGSDERAHHYYRVDDLEAVKEALGTYNAAPSWGEVRTANQYVVGPGSQLDDCDKDYCEECATPGGGRYEIVADEPIETLPAEWLVDLLDDDPAVDVDRGDEPEPEPEPAESQEPDEEDVDDEPEEIVDCHRCEAEIPESEASVLARGEDEDGEERTIWVHAGGCPA